MDVYEQLRRQARANRNRTIATANQRFEQAVLNINALQSLMGRGRYGIHTRDILRSPDGTPFSKLTALEAAERVLIECGPLNMTQLTIEVQRRGCRASDDPRRVHKG